MFVRSYIANEMPEAMERIRKELGPDAMILSNRQIRGKGLKGLFGKKLVEVTVAYEPAPGKSMIPERKAYEQPRPAPAQPAPAPKRPQAAQPAVAAAQILAQAEQRKLQSNAAPASKPSASAAPAAGAEQKPPLDRRSGVKLSSGAEAIGNRLMEREVFVGVAKKIAAQTHEITVKFNDDPEQVAYSLVQDILGEPASIKLKKYRMNIIMLLGPTGVGKTTTIVKLAGLFTINHGLKVGFINTDTYRVAAQEQLRAYAEIMELPICTVYSPEDVEDALLKMQDRDVVLIDTAGKSPADKRYREDVEAYIRHSGADELLLCVSASMGYGASRELINHYSFLSGYKLIVTKLDEVSAWGSVLNISSLAKQPIAFITTGQNVPFDISIPDTKLVAKNLLGEC
ncbi:MAG TPA: flagellar biosynthesis protein FlhF [Feifaniaceae bacterium]|nr:flagellar biosynthesis protein FlhF [Feifaniaceae bacterium]